MAIKPGIYAASMSVFNENLKRLGEINNITFISLSNKTKDIPKNTVAFGINIDSQIITLKKYLDKIEVSKTLLLSPKTQFINQTGIIEDYNVTLSLYRGKKSLQATTTISSDIDYSVKNLISEINGLRAPLSLIPENNFTAFPEKFDSLEVYREGDLPDREEILDILMGIIDSNNLTGVWTSGNIFRASSTSKGTHHWFEKDSFIFDFSLIDAKENMVKIL